MANEPAMNNMVRTIAHPAPNSEPPEDIIGRVLADGRTAGIDGVPRVGRATKKRAKEVVKALQDAGWKIVRF